MASTFAELYSDFQIKAKLYVEKLDVTEEAFMRFLTAGMQIFQRATGYLQKSVRITQNADGSYTLPEDFIEYKEVRAIPTTTLTADIPTVLNSNTSIIVSMYDPVQFFEARNLAVDGWNKVPYHHMVYRNPAKPNYMGTIYEEQFLVYPSMTDLDLYVRYIPNLPSLTQQDPWNRADDLSVPGSEVYNNWFPFDDEITVNSRRISRFHHMFSTKRLDRVFSLYEKAFVEYALAEYIMSKGNANYRVYMDNFERDIEKAKIEMPTLYREGSPYYMYAPFS